MTDIENLYKRYAGDVRRFALYLCGDVMIADEITSDTFVRAWMAADRIRQPTVKSYLFTIARNAYIDLLRRAARHTQLDENMLDTRISPLTQMEQSAEVGAVLAALQQLPEMDRTVLLMRAFDEMPYEEIAETLGAAVLWFLYFARLRRRTASLVCATLFTLIPIPFVLHSLLTGGPVAEFAIWWIVVAFIWLGYFRHRTC